jgi:hypothetical protein
MFSRAFSSVGRLLGLGQPRDPDEERRVWGRLECDIETSIEPASGGAESFPLPARVRNISRGGINLTVGCPFEPGSLVSVRLPVEGGTEVLACVVRCEQDGRVWGLGCTFSAQLSDEDLRSLGARREKSVPPDLRSWVRYPCRARATYRVVRNQTEGTAEVLNISASGIALRPDGMLHVGDMVSLELGHDSTLLTTLASVVRTATAPDGSHVVGCNFIGELPEEQVAALQ